MQKVNPLLMKKVNLHLMVKVSPQLMKKVNPHLMVKVSTQLVKKINPAYEIEKLESYLTWQTMMLVVQCMWTLMEGLSLYKDLHTTVRLEQSSCLGKMERVLRMDWRQ